MNLKKILAIVLAIGAGYIAVEVMFFVFRHLFSLVLGVMWLGLIAVFAVPAYFYIRKKLLS